MAQMTRKTEQKEEKVKEVDLFRLTEERLEFVKKRTKKYKDMRGYDDWAWLMRTVPGFW